MSDDDLRVLRTLARGLADKLRRLIARGGMSDSERETVEAMALVCGLGVRAASAVASERSKRERLFAAAATPGRN